MTDHLGAALAGWVTLAAVVIATVEALRTRPSLKDRGLLLSFLLGPGFGLITYYVGLVDVPLHGEYAPASGDELRHLVGAAFLGLASTMLAKVAHDTGLVGGIKELLAKKAEA